MTKSQKARIMFTILDCALLPGSRAAFQKHSDEDDPDGLWRHYENSLRARPEVDYGLEAGGGISFKMLKPTLAEFYELPTTD